MIQGAGDGAGVHAAAGAGVRHACRRLRTEGASLFSLLRNIGAAIGVSVTSSMLAHNTQALHEMIGASVTPFNRALAGAGRMLLDPATRHGAALLDQMVNQQAQIVAYVDDYVMLICTTLPALLLLLLMRRPRYYWPPAGAGRGDGVITQKPLPRFGREKVETR